MNNKAEKEKKYLDYTKEMEQSFLGGLLSSRERIETHLKADDFFHSDHQKIFNAIYKLWDNNTVADILAVKKELNGIVDASIIAELTTIMNSAENINYYENEVYEYSKTRQAVKKAGIFIERMNDPSLTGDGKDNALNDFIIALAGVTTVRNETIIKTGVELLTMNFPEIKWIVKDFIGEGLTMIYGAPKIGKSWFILNLAIAAAAGGKFLGSLPAKKTETLYLALEDTDRRINSRLKILGAQAADIQNLKIATRWRDGYTGLENYLKANSGIGLVIIDTLARFANIQDFNEYGETTAATAKIKRIADDLGISIVLIHHAKKTGRAEPADWTENALGSTGLTGATDTTILIERKDREKGAAVLHATGRDTADITLDLKLDLDCGGWAINNKPKGNGSGSNPRNPENDGKGLNFDWSKI